MGILRLSEKAETLKERIREVNDDMKSEQARLEQIKVSNEKIDIGDLISYRSSQVGGEYEKTYKSHFSI